MVTDLGATIRAARKRRGLSMLDLARAVDCSQNTIHRIETTDVLVLGEPKARRLASVLGLDAVEVLCAGGKVPAAAVAALCDRPELVRHLIAEGGR